MNETFASRRSLFSGIPEPDLLIDYVVFFLMFLICILSFVKGILL